jgi:hypothetical protein
VYVQYHDKSRVVRLSRARQVKDPQGVAVGCHVTTPLGRNPGGGTFPPPRRGTDKSAQGIAMGYLWQAAILRTHIVAGAIVADGTSTRFWKKPHPLDN